MIRFRKPKITFLFISALLVLFGCQQEKEKTTTMKLFYLGGQSNMEGYGLCDELPDSLNETFENVYIFHGNSANNEDFSGGLGVWEQLKPGHGVGFSSDGTQNNYSDRFGPELSFARQIQKLYPGEKIAILKYTRIGTSIDSLAAGGFGSWEPDFVGKTGINQYDHFLASLQNALSISDIDNDRKKDSLMPCAIVWMQGESDGHFTQEIAARYNTHLTNLMQLMRKAMNSENLPVVIGKIADSGDDADGKVWDFGDLIQAAQEEFVKNDNNAAIVTTSAFRFSDTYHYDSEGYIDLGTAFANAVAGLDKKRNKLSK